MIIHSVAQRSEEWASLRAGKPTSSAFSNLITGTGKPGDGLKSYAELLATETYIGGPIEDGWQGNRFTDRGIELEAEARAEYEMMKQVQVQEVGFITDDLMRWGASTDGLVGDDGLVEFKNLIATRFMKLLIYVKKHNKTPPEYIPQVQGELFVTERQWCDIMFYHPQFDFIVFRHEPIPEFQKVLKDQLMAVIAERNNILKLVRK
jgi:hypothetical protein